jgi:hypothetical protein
MISLDLPPGLHPSYLKTVAVITLVAEAVQSHIHPHDTVSFAFNIFFAVTSPFIFCSISLSFSIIPVHDYVLTMTVLAGCMCFLVSSVSFLLY